MICIRSSCRLISSSSLNNPFTSSWYRRQFYSTASTSVQCTVKDILSVAIVGRPNTGKSTLFNRLTKSKKAIVSNIPGTTRDRREDTATISGLPVRLIDTGGLDNRGAVSIDIQDQVARAFKDCHVILFMLDGRAGVTTMDKLFATWIRKQLGSGSENSQRVILVANKTEGAHLSNMVIDTIADAYALGFDEPLLISATHGDGLAELSQTLLKAAQDRQLIVDESHNRHKGENDPISIEERTIQLAIMGKPNVGKSTLLNAFIGHERAIAGPLPGLTRDAVHVEWQYQGRNFRLVDTAGLTRIRVNKLKLEKAQLKESQYHQDANNIGHVQLENTRALRLPGRADIDPETDPSQLSYQISEYALISALNALRFAQVVLLVVEGAQGRFSKLDLQLARKCLQEGRGLVIAANKTDLVTRGGIMRRDEYEAGVKEHIGNFMREFGEVPVVASAGKTKEGIIDLLNAVIKVHDAWSRRISTGTLNVWLRDTLISNPAPRVNGKKLNIKYMTQIKTRPPTFALFCNAKELPGFFERFLKSNMQTAFNLEGIPLRFIIRQTDTPDSIRKKLIKSQTYQAAELRRATKKNSTSSAENDRHFDERKKTPTRKQQRWAQLMKGTSVSSRKRSGDKSNRRTKRI